MLQHFGVTPYIIFDGDYLPSKAVTEADRHKRRSDSKKLGMELLNAGKTSQAYLEFQKAVDVTPAMARQLIDELNKVGVQYIVAPYEADAQMVYLERQGIVDGILSEDSDLLVFGAKCLLTKLDQYGNCIEVNKADFSACKEISLTGWSDREFRQMAILSGCDYLASINNMGLKTAYRMVRKHKNVEKVVRMLQFDGKFQVPKGYLEAFHQAEFTFLHQRVFDPISKQLVLHTQPETKIDEEKMAYIGAHVETEVAQGVARGILDPMTKEPIVVIMNGSTSLPTPPATPWNASVKAKQRIAAAEDLKKGIPITTFFKKRIPLAELDINSFTPSPTQQDTLRRNSGPFQTTPVRAYTTTRSFTAPVQSSSAPASAPSHTGSLGRTHARAPTFSEPRPQKRARLCEDESNGLDSLAGKGISSPFFSTPGSESSPSVSRKRQAKKGAIVIFSDAPSPEPSPPKSLAASAHAPSVPLDNSSQEPEASAVEAPTPKISLAEFRFPSADVLTPKPSPIESRTRVKNTTAFKPEQLETRKTSGDVLTPKPSPTESRLPRKLSPAVSRAPLADTIPNSRPKPASPRKSRIPLAKGRQTPLQRLGASATNRTPISRTAEVQALPTPPSTQNGSEDLIVHDSDADSDDTARPVMNLKRFAYAGGN